MAFSFVAFAYIVALIIDAFLIFFAIYHVIAFDELKTDCKHPIEQCDSLNPWVLPEYILHIFFNLLFLTSGEWFSLLINVPLIAYHINRYRTRPVMSEPGLYDATTIMNSDILTKCQREGWVKLGFYLLSFFYYLYGRLSKNKTTNLLKMVLLVIIQSVVEPVLIILGKTLNCSKSVSLLANSRTPEPNS